jgi:amino acid transporter
VPYVLAEDGWLPRWLTTTHRRYGTPWKAIVFCSAIYSLFSLSAFGDLVVVDVFLYSIALMLEFVALIVLRIKLPNMTRPFRIPGGWFVIALITILPAAIIVFAVYQNTVDSGISSLYLSFASALIPLVLWYPLKKLVKRDTPTQNVPIPLEDGTTIEVGGTRGAPSVEMGS